MADKVREFQDKIKNLQGSDQLLAAIAYFPVLGWAFPFYAKKDDELCQFHAKQAMKLNAVMLAIYFIIFVLENFPILSFIFGVNSPLHHISRAVWLITLLTYLAFSLIGAIKALEEEKWEIPKLNELVDKVLDGLKGN